VQLQLVLEQKNRVQRNQYRIHWLKRERRIIYARDGNRLSRWQEVFSDIS